MRHTNQEQCVSRAILVGSFFIFFLSTFPNPVFAKVAFEHHKDEGIVVISATLPKQVHVDPDDYIQLYWLKPDGESELFETGDMLKVYPEEPNRIDFYLREREYFLAVSNAYLAQMIWRKRDGDIDDVWKESFKLSAKPKVTFTKATLEKGSP